jgi:hypothetical protein
MRAAPLLHGSERFLLHNVARDLHRAFQAALDS